MTLIPADSSNVLSVLAGPWSGNRGADYWRHLADIACGHTVVILWSGNIHNASFLLEAGTAFDFLLPSRPDLPPDADALVVPIKVIEEKLRPGVQGLIEVLATVLAGRPSRLVLMKTPPPRRDLSALADVASRSDFWRQSMEQLGIDPSSPQFTRASVRLKLWTLLMEITADTAKRAGAGIIGIPPQALDAMGFLRPEYGAADLTHAGTAYGELAVAHIQATLSLLEAA